MSRASLRMDLSPLRVRDFRLLFASGTVTQLGTQATEVALVVQVKQLTGSAFAVGLLGAAELVPLVAFALYGGVLADRLDRRRVVRWCEAALGCCAALLLAVSALPRPPVWPLYVVTALMTAAGAVQRPSLDASIPRVVPRDRLTAAAALLSSSQSLSVIAGGALGGVLAAGPGPLFVYALDTASFAVSFGLLVRLRPLPAPPASPAGERGPAPGLRGLLEGLRYARGRPDLLGSYLADLTAMIMAYPNALFPFVAVALHANWAVGLMFAAPSAGAVAVTVMSGWMTRVRRHGLAIAIAAGVWGLAVTAFGLAPDIGVALAALVVAGAADMVSGIFRDTLWNQTIPDALRGRLAGVEMLSYAVGPSAGQLRAGLVASLSTPRIALASGGVACVAAVGVVCLAFPAFTAYASSPAVPAVPATPAPAIQGPPTDSSNPPNVTAPSTPAATPGGPASEAGISRPAAPGNDR
jgi:MFS family permease